MITFFAARVSLQERMWPFLFRKEHMSVMFYDRFRQGNPHALLLNNTCVLGLFTTFLCLTLDLQIDTTSFHLGPQQNTSYMRLRGNLQDIFFLNHLIDNLIAVHLPEN